MLIMSAALILFSIISLSFVQLFSCAADNQLIKWDFTDGVLLHKYDIGYPLLSLYACPGNNQNLTLFGVRQKPVDGKY